MSRFFVVACIFLASCATTHDASSFKVPFTIEDNPKENRIYVKYLNDEAKPICLDPENWPNAEGKIDAGKGRVFIRASGVDHTTENFDTGYCPGCATRV